MKRQMIMLSDLNCPTCAAKLEKSAQQLPGMKSAKVSFGTGNLTVEYDEARLDEETIRKTVKQHGVEISMIMNGSAS
jgi:copper chaperone CopZ